MTALSQSLGIYIHIPFCRSKCDYCDFYSIPGGESTMVRYQKALLKHLAETAPLCQGRQVDSVYFGGGTPSYYGEARLRELLGAVKKRFSLTRDAEITLEANPDSVNKRDLTRLRRAGFNRLSLGVQSACDRELAALHRPHTFAQAQEAVAAARKAKLKNVSLDLIYGLPGQTPEGWLETLEAVLALEPEHISCYGLTVEPTTPLGRRVAAGEVLPDDDTQADCYLAAVSRLEERGYHQYEISNFAKPGHLSRHNLKYWLGREYVGFGPGAHSDFGARRYSFIRDLEGYIGGVMGGGKIIDEDDLIPKRERAGEYLMLRLRTSHGIEEWEYRREYFMNFDPIAAKLSQYERLGWAMQQERRWRFTPEGFLRSNQLIGELLDLQETATLQNTLGSLQRQREESVPIG
ncbi:MAG: radical SAM family heme chaperone HemW [Oscillospiraceae bacterium]